MIVLGGGASGPPLVLAVSRAGVATPCVRQYILQPYRLWANCNSEHKSTTHNNHSRCCCQNADAASIRKATPLRKYSSSSKNNKREKLEGPRSAKSRPRELLTRGATDHLPQREKIMQRKRREAANDSAPAAARTTLGASARLRLDPAGGGQKAPAHTPNQEREIK